MPLDTEPRLQARARRTPYQRVLDGIRNDDSLTREGKRLLMANAVHQERVAKKQLQDEHRRIEADERLRLERAVHGPEFDLEHPDLRAALQAVEGLDTPALVAALEKAHRRGDTVMARACLSVGVDRMRDGVVDRWCQLYPDGAEAVQHLAHHHREVNDLGDRLVASADFRVPVPPELKGMLDSQIEAIGRQHESGSGQRPPALGYPA